MLVPVALALWLAAVPLLAYPVFGTKRYGRSQGAAAGAVAAAAPGAVSGAWPRAYYPDYHYAQQPQPPLAYPYAPLSYYYEPPRQHPGYGYYNYDDDMLASDPIEDIEEEIQQEAEREQREEALPIGQEMWFEHSSPRDDTAEVNSQFLRNLILSQLYSDEQQRQRAAAAASLYPHAQAPQLYLHPQVPVQQQVPYGLPLLPEHEERLLADDAAAWEYTSSARQLPYPYGTEEDAAPAAYDEDVVELKSLVKKARQHATAAGAAQKRPEFATELGPWFEGGMRFSDRKAPAGDATPAAPAAPATTTAAPATTTTTTTTPRPAFDDKRRGMKEVAMPRPATPVRRPTGTRSGSHTSVYDTIRHLLSMEAGLQEKEEVSRRPPQKRFVSSEEALVEQLGGLHKPLST